MIVLRGEQIRLVKYKHVHKDDDEAFNEAVDEIIRKLE